MITIELAPDQQARMQALAVEHPDLIQQVKLRNATGGGGDMSYLVSLAAIVVPAVRAVVIEWIKAGKFKTFALSYEGKKITTHTHSADDIVKILEEMKDEPAGS
jgi:hypothetical protein